MKPLLLKISGINSFNEMQIIDFTKLTDKGLFGIFGPTGSGKSTILDAITLALYDKTARKSSNFINEDTKKGYVYFEFEIKRNDNIDIYVIERTYKLDEKGESKINKSRLYLKKGTPIAENTTGIKKAIENIIGLTYEDFSRSVVLPQGKFSEFLTLKYAERRNMLERIFHLEKYGSILREKLKNRKIVAEGNLKELYGKLEVYGDITQEKINNELYELNILEKKLYDINIIFEEITKKYKDSSELWQTIQEFDLYNNRLKSLNDDNDNYKNLSLKIERAKKTQKILPLYDSYNDKVKDYNDITLLSQKCQEQKDIAYQKELDITKDYNKISELKNNLYPKLIKDEEIFKNAVIINNEIKEIKKERTELHKQYKSIKLDLEQYNNQFNVLSKEKNKFDKELDNIIEQKNKNYIEFEYKSKISKGAEFEKNISENTKIIELINNKIDNIEFDLKSTEKSLNEVKAIGIETNSLFKKYDNELTNLNNKYSDNELTENIIKFEKKLNILEIELKNIVDNSKKIDNLNNDIVLLNKNLVKCQKNQENLSDKYNDCEKNFNNLENEISATENGNMAGILAELLKDGTPCPVCGSKNHPSPAKHIMEGVIYELNLKKENLKDKKNELFDEIQNLKIEIEKIKTEKENKENSLNELKKSISEKSISEIKNEKENIKNLLCKNKKNLEHYNFQKNILTEKLNDYKNKLVDMREKYSTFFERRKNINNKKNELFIEKEETEKKIKDLKSSILDLKFNNIQNFTLELKRIENCDIQREKLEKQEFILRDKLKKVEEELINLTFKINENNKNIEIISLKGKEKTYEIEEKNKKVFEITKDKDPETELKNIQIKIENIIKDENTIKEKFEKIKAENEIINNEFIRTKKQEEILLNFKNEIEKKLLKICDENNFKSLEDLKDSIIQNDILIELENKKTDYENKLYECNANLERLKKKKNGKTITENEVISINEELEKIKQEKENISNSLAIKQNNIKKIKSDFEAIKELKKKEKILSHNLEVINDMTKIMSGNQFVAFVAINQLRYITKEASKRLFQITNGRYTLELDGSDFIIMDNFNGGTTRKPDTLSGGEVFLTSFALALALSSKIQMKNSAPLEFFFLDEGFGTLDNNLIDVVMESLERLHNENLNVGIITHIEELKERIPVRLMVIPPEPKISGSRVKIEIM